MATTENKKRIDEANDDVHDRLQYFRSQQLKLSSDI